MNTLLTQLNQLMCARNYTITESTIASLVNILAGFFGAFVLNYLAKRLKLQTEFAKICFGLASISTILMMIALGGHP